MSLPPTETLPSVGVMNPVIMRMEVDLPAPFGPRKPSTSPRSTEKEIPSTARFVPKTFTKFSTLIMVVYLKLSQVNRGDNQSWRLGKEVFPAKCQIVIGQQFTTWTALGKNVQKKFAVILRQGRRLAPPVAEPLRCRMSKAFTREDDSTPESELRPRAPLRLPGAKQFLTASGARRLKADLEQWLQKERPALAARVDDSDAKRRLQILDARSEELRRILAAATVVEPPPLPWDQVRFGASVTVRNRAGAEEHYRLVGLAELDADRGWVSAVSPIGRALLNARLGQRVRFKFPTGEDELEIVQIAYE
jgi:transcription elongation factor GreB